MSYELGITSFELVRFAHYELSNFELHNLSIHNRRR